MKDVAGLCKLLGDTSRLRLLRLLRHERLNVSELVGVTGLSQPGVSRHLKMLRQAGLVREHKEGSWTYYEAAGNGHGSLSSLRAALEDELARAPDLEGDLARLDQALLQRRERSSAPFSEREGLPIPGRSWIAWSRALLRLVPPLDVADLGCGECGLALEIARRARRVYAIDRSPEVLARARARVTAAGLANIVLRRGELEKVPLRAAQVDVALLSQALHHAASPPKAVREAARVLRKGGLLLVTDLEPHGEEWVRERLGDLWLGFSRARLEELLRAAGLEDVEYESVPARRGEAFRINLTSGRKPRA